MRHGSSLTSGVAAHSGTRRQRQSGSADPSITVKNTCITMGSARSRLFQGSSLIFRIRGEAFRAFQVRPSTTHGAATAEGSKRQERTQRRYAVVTSRFSTRDLQTSIIIRSQHFVSMPAYGRFPGTGGLPTRPHQTVVSPLPPEPPCEFHRAARYLLSIDLFEKGQVLALGFLPLFRLDATSSSAINRSAFWLWLAALGLPEP